MTDNSNTNQEGEMDFITFYTRRLERLNPKKTDTVQNGNEIDRICKAIQIQDIYMAINNLTWFKSVESKTQDHENFYRVFIEDVKKCSGRLNEDIKEYIKPALEYCTKQLNLIHSFQEPIALNKSGSLASLAEDFFNRHIDLKFYNHFLDSYEVFDKITEENFKESYRYKISGPRKPYSRILRSKKREEGDTENIDLDFLLKLINMQRIYDISKIDVLLRLERNVFEENKKHIGTKIDASDKIDDKLHLKDFDYACRNRYRLISEFDNKIFKSARGHFGQLYGFIRLPHPDSDVLYNTSGEAGYFDPLEKKKKDKNNLDEVRREGLYTAYQSIPQSRLYYEIKNRKKVKMEKMRGEDDADVDNKTDNPEKQIKK